MINHQSFGGGGRKYLRPTILGAKKSYNRRPGSKGRSNQKKGKDRRQEIIEKYVSRRSPFGRQGGNEKKRNRLIKKTAARESSEGTPSERESLKGI